MIIDRHSIGYHDTGGRFDYFSSMGFACVVDTLTKNTSDWMPVEQARSQAGYLNSGTCFEI
jgi:hypothetical protein